MTILELIIEWRKGCSNTTDDNPVTCPMCTVGLIEAIEKQAIKNDFDMAYLTNELDKLITQIKRF